MTDSDDCAVIPLTIVRQSSVIITSWSIIYFNRSDRSIDWQLMMTGAWWRHDTWPTYQRYGVWCWRHGFSDEKQEHGQRQQDRYTYNTSSLIVSLGQSDDHDQNPLHTFPRNFPETVKLPTCCGLVSDTVQVRNKSTTSRCSGIWETTRHNIQTRTFAHVNLLRTCYGETGVMDFGL